MRGREGENATKKIETEGKVQQDSAATHTHQDKHLHTAVGAHAQSDPNKLGRY